MNEIPQADSRTPPDGDLRQLDLPGSWYRSLLVCLLLFFLFWDLYAILTDLRFGATDTTLEEMLDLQADIRDEGLVRGLSSWIEEIVKGPLAGMALALLNVMVKDPIVACRLMSVLLHALVLWLAGMFVVRLSGWRVGGLVAVVLCGTFTPLYGWFRLEYHEPFTAAATLLFLWVLLGELGRVSDGARLGLVTGLGMLGKLSLPLFVLPPLVWFVACRLRRLRQVAGLLLALALALLLTGWWVVPHRSNLLAYLAQSRRQAALSWIDALHTYTLDLEGGWVFILSALLGALLALRARIAPAHLVGALTICLLGSLALLVFWFDPWSRYLVPALPPAGILSSLGVAAAARWACRRLPRWLVAGVMGVMLLCLLALFMKDNLVQTEKVTGNREQLSGLVVPDRLTYRGYLDAIAYLRGQGWRVADFVGGNEVSTVTMEEVWYQRGFVLPREDGEQALSRFQQGQVIFALLCHREGDPLQHLRRLAREGYFNDRERAVLAASAIWLEDTFHDPDDLSYSVIALRRKVPPGR